jgi:ubiquinone/menaquinone biosynthesis C-methylase UbiE
MSQHVKDFYDKNAEVEWKRLDLPLCKIELASTLHLIEKYFPEAGRVCDIGGGPGRYTIELIRRGYRVSLLDISEQEIALARTELEKAGLSAEQLIVGDALDLSQLDSESFDAALLLGPLYHIVDSERRLAILKELRRILRPGGTAIIAYLNCWGLVKTGIVDFPSQFRDITTLRTMLAERSFSGQSLKNFPECYWSNPKIALSEIKKGGLRVISYAGAESFANGMGLHIQQLAETDPQAYDNIVKFAAETCELEQYRDSTDHLHIVAVK